MSAVDTITPERCLLLEQTDSTSQLKEESLGELKAKQTLINTGGHLYLLRKPAFRQQQSETLSQWLWRVVRSPLTLEKDQTDRTYVEVYVSRSRFARGSLAPSLPLSCVLKVATRLFSGQELSALRRDASFRRQIEEGLVMEVDPPTSATTGGARGRGGGPKGDPVAGGLKDRDPRDWSEVSWKSICLARKEKELRACHAKEKKGTSPNLDSEEKSQTGDAGAGKSAGGTGRGGAEAKAGRGRSLQETESSSMRQHARKREDEVLAGGAQNFYKPVRVCGSCFRVSRFCLCFAELCARGGFFY